MKVKDENLQSFLFELPVGTLLEGVNRKSYIGSTSRTSNFFVKKNDEELLLLEVEIAQTNTWEVIFNIWPIFELSEFDNFEEWIIHGVITDIEAFKKELVNE